MKTNVFYITSTHQNKLSHLNFTFSSYMTFNSFSSQFNVILL